MKIAVTGHTSGLGKAFFEHYQAQGHNVVGFSRSNKYDLRDWTKLQLFLDVTANCDLIVSNAKPDFVQCTMLYELARRNNRAKHIISIGSQIINFDLPRDIDLGINLYKTQKLALKNAHEQLVNKLPDFHSTLIHPGHLYDDATDSLNTSSQWILRMEQKLQNSTRIELDVY